MYEISNESAPLQLDWYVNGDFIEGNHLGPFPWLIGQSDIIELQAVGHPLTARKGDATELNFMGRACRLDLRVAKPWGNADPYDVLIAFGPRGFWRVQVKLAPHKNDRDQNVYQAPTYTRRGPYTKHDIDFLAAYVED